MKKSWYTKERIILINPILLVIPRFISLLSSTNLVSSFALFFLITAGLGYVVGRLIMLFEEHLGTGTLPLVFQIIHLIVLYLLMATLGGLLLLVYYISQFFCLHCGS